MRTPDELIDRDVRLSHDDRRLYTYGGGRKEQVQSGEGRFLTPQEMTVELDHAARELAAAAELAEKWARFLRTVVQRFPVMDTVRACHIIRDLGWLAGHGDQIRVVLQSLAHSDHGVVERDGESFVVPAAYWRAPDPYWCMCGVIAEVPSLVSLWARNLPVRCINALIESIEPNCPKVSPWVRWPSQIEPKSMLNLLTGVYEPLVAGRFEHMVLTDMEPHEPGELERKNIVAQARWGGVNETG